MKIYLVANERTQIQVPQSTVCASLSKIEKSIGTFCSWDLNNTASCMVKAFEK